MAVITGLTSALSGMQVAQSQISLISNNLANVDTEGYTRKTAHQLSNVVSGKGVGVKLANTERQVSQSLLRSYLIASSVNGSLSRTYDYLTKTENLVGTPSSDNSIAADVANMQASFETLATDVTSSANRYTLVSDATNLASRLNTLSKEIQSLRGDADLEIEQICGDINNKLETIANLNNQIVKYKALGYDGAADLEDQRDEALKAISNYIDISYYTRDTGEVVIQTTGGVSLLDRDPHVLTHGAVARAATDISYANGNINGIIVDDVDITSIVKSGELKGLIDVRDSILPSLQTQLDELAGVMRQTVNAIHNQGTSYPGVVTKFEGSRSFINPNQQIIKIEQGDVRFTIFDKDGNQVTTTSLVGDLNFGVSGSETVTDLVHTIDSWLKQTLPFAMAHFDENGRVTIDTGDSSYYLSIMDTANSTIGSEHTDAVISLDHNNDGVADRTFSGFSSFLGLNDLFVTSSSEYIYTTNVMSKNSDLGIRSNVLLNISVPGDGADRTTTISLGVGDTIETIAEKINSDDTLDSLVRASLVPNGNGYMLQITNSSGEQMEIYEVAQGGNITGLLSRIGLGVSSCNEASKIQVREDIQINPNILSVGAPEFNTNTGKYHLNDGNNSVANRMAKAFAEEHTFGQAGSLSKVTTSIANYASTFVGNIAGQTSNASANKDYQEGLVSSISNKQSLMSGVDSDEELANLIIYQQSYAACAQVWSATRELVDILFNAL